MVTMVYFKASQDSICDAKHKKDTLSDPKFLNWHTIQSRSNKKKKEAQEPFVTFSFEEHCGYALPC